MAVSTTIDNAALAPVVSRPTRLGGLAGADRLWAIAFSVPYVAVFLLFNKLLTLALPQGPLERLF